MLTKLLSLNEGFADRAVRIGVGLAVLSLAFWGPRTPWAWAGLLPLATGFAGFCPLYAVLRLSTRGSR